MKCDVIQSLIARQDRGELSRPQQSEVVEHLASCPRCQEMAAFHRSLDYRMDGPMHAPETLLAKVTRHTDSLPERPGIFSRIFGDPTMKKILISSTAVTAVVAGALLLIPVTASASTPVAKFKAMRAALARAAHSGELTLTAIVSREGVVVASGFLDGQPLSPDIPLHVDVKKDGNVYDITITADLSPANYSSIKFGKDQSTLELTPKNAPNRRIEIGLDPATQKPVSWTSFAYAVPLDPTKKPNLSESSAWKPTSHFDYSPKATGSPAGDGSNTITAHIKMIVPSAPTAS